MPVQIFCVRPQIELHLVPLHFVLAQKMNLLTKFWSDTKTWTAQNFLGPVEGQGINHSLKERLNALICSTYINKGILAT